MTPLRRSLAILAIPAALLAPAARLGAQAPDTIRMVLRWAVVEGEHPTADSLGRLSGIAVDRAGHVYVSDLAESRIWVFGPDGRSLPAIGRKGKGPGEFEAPTGLAISPDGKLVVRHLSEVSRFTRDPATGRLSRYETRFQGPPMADWMSGHATRFDADGRAWVPQFNVIDRTRQSGVFLAYAPTGTLADSIVVPAFATAPTHSVASIRESAHGGRIVQGLSHVPFHPLPVWDITPRGTLVSGDAVSYLLRETDRRGQLVREYRRAGAPERIPPAERRDSAAAQRARLDSVRAPASQVEGVPPEVRAGRLPETYPAYLAVHAAPDGLLWVRRWVPRGHERTVFDVFGADGRLRAVVVLPRNIAATPSPVLALDGVAAIGIDPETGAHGVLRFVAPASRR